MYAALLKNKLVLAVEEAEQVRLRHKELNCENYRCPHCQKKVILILSEKKAAFFKHVNLYYSNQLGEKEEHYTSKMLIKSAFTAAGFNAKTEIPLADGQIRADVLVANNFAIEVQCAPLSRQEFKQRHHWYLHEKILDLWIVGQRHYLKRKLKQTQLIYFRENEKWGNYYLEVDAQRQLLRLKFNVWQEPVTRSVRYQVKCFKLDEDGIKEFWQFKPIKKKYFVNTKQQRSYITKQIQQKTKLGQKIAEQLYLNKLALTDLPETIFTRWRKPGSQNNLIAFLNKKTNQR